MRDFRITAEPSGGGQLAGDTALPFCIQKHAASHLHYDFRLGWKGVLKSWACAKGPSYVVKDKRLAVQVEDHPIEYGGFEGVIPAGQYGGGTVMLWDQGTWSPQPGHEDVDAGLRDGQLKFTLQGVKLQGKWALIRMAPRAWEKDRPNAKPNWLLIKEHDALERAPDAPAVTEAEPDSVITGRSLEQIAASQDHVWNSNHPENSAASTPAPAARSSPAAKKASSVNHAPARKAPARKAPARSSHAPLRNDALADLPEEPQPDFVKPQLCQESEAPPEGNAWLHELKLDGYRMQARKDGAQVQLLTRSGLDWTTRFQS
jgi:bifunctional non-homologous end joining protein LigD